MMRAFLSRRTSAPCARAALLLALGLGLAVVSADVSAECASAIRVPKGDGATVAMLVRDAPCASIEAPLMRRVLLSGIRLSVDSQYDANAREDAPAVPPLRVRVTSVGGNFLSLTAAGEQALAQVTHPFHAGDGVLDKTIEFVASADVASTLLASLEFVNTDLGILHGQASAGVTEDVGDAETRGHESARETSSQKNSKNPFADVVWVDVFADTSANAAAAQKGVRLEIDITLRGGQPFGWPDGERKTFSNAAHKNKGSMALRNTPVAAALLACVLLLAALVRAVARVCLPIPDENRERKKFQKALAVRLAKRKQQQMEMAACAEPIKNNAPAARNQA